MKSVIYLFCVSLFVSALNAETIFEGFKKIPGTNVRQSAQDTDLRDAYVNSVLSPRCFDGSGKCLA